jgi:hypothetical protein
VGRRTRSKMLHPLAAIRIMICKDTTLALWMATSSYARWHCVQTWIPPIYKKFYNFSELQVDLPTLPEALVL